MDPAATDPAPTRAPKRPRDAQRSRVYLAETPLPSSLLPGLDACARFVDRVVGTLWWQERFPTHDLAGVPRLRPGKRPPPGLLPRGGDGADDPPPPPLPHEGCRPPRAHALGARHRLRPAAPRAHVRARAGRSRARVRRPRTRRAPRRVLPGAAGARRQAPSAWPRRPPALRMGRAAPP